MKKIILYIIPLLLLASSCICKYNFGQEKADCVIDFFGDAVTVKKVMHQQKHLVIRELARPGKTNDDIRDFVGFTMNGGIVYVYIDTREILDGFTDNMIAELNAFKKEWLNGDYEMYDRKTCPIWVVYGDNEELMLKLCGYYKGAGWHIFQLGDESKQYFDDNKDLKDVNFFKYLDNFVNRPPIHCENVIYNE